ncbi:hypothetical protein [Rubinisphaera margarita]|uniref:hypothetical protein n=1 Tax=Rubinisphaera margarita TaxID=2909586 RepID=UPI001EE7E0A2|nr:hypothetical protein [Rubinisphaera margarita]MCG6157643.1 hypothetical protein [Rubinisphaera margarita]
MEYIQQQSDSIEIGDIIPGKGVYAGKWSSKNQDGQPTGEKFSVYAAPEDLREGNGQSLALSFNDAVVQVAQITNLLGHNGASFGCDEEIGDAVIAGRYDQLAKWFVPPADVLVENLYENSYEGGFRYTFSTANNLHSADWYWSCTRHGDDRSQVASVQFSRGLCVEASWGGVPVWRSKDHFRLSVRPIRLEPIV